MFNLIAMGAAALSGHTKLARDLLEHTLQFYPSLHIADVAEIVPMRRAEHAALWREGLCRAGVPGS